MTDRPQTVSPDTFRFGRNWRNFLSTINEADIAAAQASLLAMLHRSDLSGLSFLDVGCGSGLFSLAAARLGARSVTSIDVDPDSVGCAQTLNERYGPFHHWQISTGSALDTGLLASLGKHDIVYSWGVLHHTGDMWHAIDNVTGTVADTGQLFISIYNDQGTVSRLWERIKRFYNHSSKPVQFGLCAGYYIVVLTVNLLKGVVQLKPPRTWFSAERGMNLWYDVVDWVGGYPFETAKSEELIRFLRDRGFCLTELRLKRGSGCNELVFRRVS